MNDCIHTFVVLAFKESKYLEDCIKSVLNQEYPSKVIIATSTPNEYIRKMAEKYKLDVVVNTGKKGIGYDFDFAYNTGNTRIVTIAHQDDIYDYTYSSRVVDAYLENTNSIIIFSDYYEIRDKGKVYINTNLKIKRILLAPLKAKSITGNRFVKRIPIMFGNSICCPAVSYVKDNIPFSSIFACDFKCNVDWYGWEKLSKLKGKFSFINECLMGHRVHEESTTTEIIENNIRTVEDEEMLCKFWPKPIVKGINSLYKKSEKSNRS